MNLQDVPHRRYNPLTDEWVLVSPHRAKRPWQGQVEKTEGDGRPPHDPACYLCAGNIRANGERNPDYTGTFVFSNDFAALLPRTVGERPQEGLFRAEPTGGECRVICFSPRHDLTLAEMEVADIGRVVETWVDQARELGERWRWVQVFENKGAVMGCSNPHPHGQIWAGDFLPTEAEKELRAQAAHLASTGRSLLVEVAEAEGAAGERVVCQNDEWLYVVPFWATWPFEMLLLPKRPVARLQELDEAQRESLAPLMKEALGRYDALFQTSFPYTMGWHGAPHGMDAPGWQLHAHYYPPLLRSATVRKFMVGYEMLAEAQRDLTPETAAARLREA